VEAIVIALRGAHDRALYGGKAAGLAAALRAGLPVPDGVALDWSEALDPPALPGDLGPVAVRSSAVDEDGAGASFAGQHRTHVNVAGEANIRCAIADVVASARSASAMAYRARLGLVGEPRMAIVIQRVIAAGSAGVMFTRHPATGADERIVEAAWGLGEAVVAGLVTPDVYRWPRGGRASVQVGDKEVALRPAAGGGCEEVAVEPTYVRARVLSDAQLAALDELAARCEQLAGAAVDLEWAFEGDRLYLLQCRRITR
jgi:pyruvate,water dikinase